LCKKHKAFEQSFETYEKLKEAHSPLLEIVSICVTSNILDDTIYTHTCTAPTNTPCRNTNSFTNNTSLVVGNETLNKEVNPLVISRDENEREQTGNIINRFRYHIFSSGTGAGAGQSEVGTGAGYTGIRKRINTNEN
jgi:hypothetical protein